MAEKVEIKITPEKVDEITIDEFIAIQDGKVRIVKAILARFVWDKATNTYMDEKLALALVGKLTIGQLKEIMANFTSGVTDAVVPSQNSGLSD